VVDRREEIGIWPLAMKKDPRAKRRVADTSRLRPLATSADIEVCASGGVVTGVSGDGSGVVETFQGPNTFFGSMPSLSPRSLFQAFPNHHGESYNDTPFNRLNISLQIALSKRFRNRRHTSNSSIIFLSSKRVLSTVGLFTSPKRLLYASSLNLLAFPFPKFIVFFRDEKTGVSYILMERIDGEPIVEGWEMRTEMEKKNLLNQLKEMFEELRTIPNSRAGQVCAADGGKLHDYRIYGGAGEKGMGPFENERIFNLFLRNGMEPTAKMQNTAEETKADFRSLMDWHRAREERNPNTVFYTWRREPNQHSGERR